MRSGQDCIPQAEAADRAIQPSFKLAKYYTAAKGLEARDESVLYTMGICTLHITGRPRNVRLRGVSLSHYPRLESDRSVTTANEYPACVPYVITNLTIKRSATCPLQSVPSSPVFVSVGLTARNIGKTGTAPVVNLPNVFSFLYFFFLCFLYFVQRDAFEKFKKFF